MTVLTPTTPEDYHCLVYGGGQKTEDVNKTRAHQHKGHFSVNIRTIIYAELKKMYALICGLLNTDIHMKPGISIRPVKFTYTARWIPAWGPLRCTAGAYKAYGCRIPEISRRYWLECWSSWWSVGWDLGQIQTSHWRRMELEVWGLPRNWSFQCIPGKVFTNLLCNAW